MRLATVAALSVLSLAARATAQEPPVSSHEAPLDSPDDRRLAMVCDARGATVLTSSMALRWDGRAWRGRPAPGGGWAPRSAAVLGDGTLYVSEGAAVHRLSSEGWARFVVEGAAAPPSLRQRPRLEPEAPLIEALTAAGPARVVGVGGDRVFLRDGAGFRAFGAGTWQPLVAIWASSPDELWAVGAGDAVQRWDGARWRTLRTEAHADWRGVTGSGPRDVWLWSSVRLVHYDGRRFRDLSASLPTTPEPLVVEGVATDGAETFVATSAGVLRREGDRWLTLVETEAGDEALVCATHTEWIAVSRSLRMWSWPRRAPPAELAPPMRPEEE